MSDVRSVLEGIAYGTDPQITPADRLRAAERLLDLGSAVAPPSFAQEVYEMDDATLERELDDLCADDMVASVIADDGRYPKLASLVRGRVEERARELADADRIEHEIERRSTERARWLLEREVGPPPPEPTTDDDAGSEEVALRGIYATQPARIPPPPGIDLTAGFRRRGSGLRRG